MLAAGIGAALTCRLRMPAFLRWGLWPSLGLGAAIALSSCLLWLHLYSAITATLVLAGCCIISGGLACVRIPSAVATATGQSGSATTESGRRLYRHLGILIAPLILWCIGIALSPRRTDGVFGLLATPGGLSIALSVLILVTIAVRGIVLNDLRLAAAAIVVTILAIRLPVSVLTEVPLYSWTYKHIGLVDYVMHTGGLPPSHVDIYSRWPGFFAGAAWFSGATGIDPVDVAHWFTPVLHLLIAAVVWGLARSLRLSQRAALLAVLIVEIANWVGQDYYSPQAVAMVLALALITLLAGSRISTATACFTIPLMAALSLTHQLTPIWVLTCALLLTALDRVRPRWLVVACAAIWLAYVLPRLSTVMHYGLFTGSNPFANAQTNIGGAASESAARTVTETVDRGVAFAIWFSAVAAFVYLWRRRSHDWALPIIAFTPVLLLGGQSYGGEAIFRVYLWSLVGCALLIGSAVTALVPVGSVPPEGRPRVRTVTVTVLICLVTLGSLHGYYSGWGFNVITRQQVELSRAMLARAEPATLILTLAPAGWPERPSEDYVRIVEANPGYDRAPAFPRGTFPSDADMTSLDNMGRSSGGGVRLVVPRQMSVYSDHFGYFHRGAIDAFVARLDESPDWRREHEDSDTLVFRYHHIPSDDEPW